MNPIKIIEKYYEKGTPLYGLLISHSKKVTQKALEVAKRVPELKPNIKFIEEAGMLHDIGIFRTDAPPIHCFGKEHYLMHGPIGREILEKEGYPKLALVCDRHIGVGITKEEIISNRLPLPHRDLVPVSVEEKIISFADLFFSKIEPDKERTIDEVKDSLRKHGEHKVRIFEKWLRDLKYF